MTDLYDLLEESNTEEAIELVGGDLYDQLAIATDNPELFSGDAKRKKDILVDRLFSIEIAEGNRAAEQRDIAALNEGLGSFDRFKIGAGRGLTNIARAFGLAEQESNFTKKAIADLGEGEIAMDVGQVVGEAAPFLIGGPITAMAKTTGGKIAAGIGLGLTEGGIIAKGQGADLAGTVGATGIGGIIGGVSEAVFPVIGRVGGALFRSLGLRPRGPLLTPEGTPTPEFQEVLDRTGTTFDDVAEEATTIINANPLAANPEDIVRKARFESQGIRATEGDISQNFESQAVERRLEAQIGEETSQQLRDLRLAQSQEFEAAADNLIKTLGVPSEAGDTIKAALLSKQKITSKNKNALYKEIFENSPEASSIPVMTQGISNAIIDPKKLRRLKRIMGKDLSEATDELLVEFGVIKDGPAYDSFISSDGIIEPLSLGNAEEFRQGLNAIGRADTTGTVKVITGPLIDALDGELDELDIFLKNNGVEDVEILDLAKKARAETIKLKTEFSPQSIVGTLIGKKSDNFTPVVESSQVSKKLLSPNAPIENLERTLKMLAESKGGKEAIGNLQATTVLNAIEDAVRATSNKGAGEQMLTMSMFVKSLNKLGDDKLDLLFSNNTKGLSLLKGLKQTATDITPAANAVPKGSASVIQDIFNKIGRAPGFASIVEPLKFVFMAGKDQRAVNRAIQADPVILRKLRGLEQEFPAIVASLGIASVVPSVVSNNPVARIQEAISSEEDN